MAEVITFKRESTNKEAQRIYREELKRMGGCEVVPMERKHLKKYKKECTAKAVKHLR